MATRYTRRPLPTVNPSAPSVMFWPSKSRDGWGNPSNRRMAQVGKQFGAPGGSFGPLFAPCIFFADSTIHMLHSLLLSNMHNPLFSLLLSNVHNPLISIYHYLIYSSSKQTPAPSRASQNYISKSILELFYYYNTMHINMKPCKIISIQIQFEKKLGLEKKNKYLAR
jgi:hypothetical protein